MRLTKATDISSGYPFRGKIREKIGSGIRVIQMKDVSSENTILWERLLETELAGTKKPDWIAQGDILFAARGSRNYAVLANTEGGAKQGNIVSAPHFYRLRVTTNVLLPEFLVWQLNGKPMQTYFSRSAEGSVTKSVRRSILENAEINVPTLENQQEILRLHSILQKEKAIYTELISNAEKLMNAIAKDLMSGNTIMNMKSC